MFAPLIPRGTVSVSGEPSATDGACIPHRFRTHLAPRGRSRSHVVRNVFFRQSGEPSATENTDVWSHAPRTQRPFARPCGPTRCLEASG